MGRGVDLSHTESRLEGTGGRSIYWQAWVPDGTPQAVVVVAHGASEHSGRYAHVAARLERDRLAVYAIDHRGHGRSDGPRALIDRLDAAVSDLDALVVLASNRHPGTPVFLLGHSMGGTVSLAYALQHQERLAGLLLSGPLAALEAAPAPLRVAARILSALAPRLPLVSIDASLVSRDPEVVRAYVEDPLVYHGKLPVRTVAELAGAIERFPSTVGAITIPTLIMYGTEDRLVPPEGSVMLSERIGARELTVKPYEGLYHEILNEPEQQQVMDDLCVWIASRSPAVAA